MINIHSNNNNSKFLFPTSESGVFLNSCTRSTCLGATKNSNNNNDDKKKHGQGHGYCHGHGSRRHAIQEVIKGIASSLAVVTTITTTTLGTGTTPAFAFEGGDDNVAVAATSVAEIAEAAEAVATETVQAVATETPAATTTTTASEAAETSLVSSKSSSFSQAPSQSPSPQAAASAIANTVGTTPVEITPLSTDSKKLFNEARALESQGNMAAARRLYDKITKISPRFIYGWSNLGNTQVALGDLQSADINYSQAISLCQESSKLDQEAGFGIKKCKDLYLLLVNRGSVRLNTPSKPNYKQEALRDLREANTLRDRPDAIISQNLARAEELNGLYSLADKNYNLAISMTANEVNPYWLRSAMVKLQLGDYKGGTDLLKRVENRFPDAPEVKAASATFLWSAASRATATKATTTTAAVVVVDSESGGDSNNNGKKKTAKYDFNAVLNNNNSNNNNNNNNNNINITMEPREYQIEA